MGAENIALAVSRLFHALSPDRFAGLCREDFRSDRSSPNGIERVGPWRLVIAGENHGNRGIMMGVTRKIMLFAALGCLALWFRSIKKCYDRFATRYDKLFGESQDVNAEAVLSYLRETNVAVENALDIGCGTGILTGKLASVANRVTGVDFSRGMLDVAAMKFRENSRIKFIYEDCLRFETPNRRAELITALGLLPHIPESKTGDWARKIKNSLAPGGRLIIALAPLPWRLLFRGKPIGDFSLVDKALIRCYDFTMRLFALDAGLWYCRANAVERILEVNGFYVKTTVRNNVLIIDAIMEKGR